MDVNRYSDQGPARRWLIIGAPMEGSGTGRGERRAPAALREAGVVDELRATDFGDLAVGVDDPERDPATGITGYRDVLAGSLTIREGIAASLSAGWHPLVLGGCCSVLPGALAGVRERLGPVALAFVDGHVDLYDRETSSTGEVAGMDLAIVCGHGDEDLTGLAGGRPIVDPGDVVAVGDADGARRARLGAPGPDELIPDAHVISAARVAERGAERCGAELERLVGEGTAPFWLHLDVDVLDEGVMPAVSFPVRSGIGWDDLEALVRPLAASPRLVGVTLADLNVDHDPDGAVARRIARLLGALFGYGKLPDR